jgi:uncharacterized protein YqeY
MSLSERVAADLTAAMKQRDAARTAVLRMAKAALKNREIDKRAPLEASEEIKVLGTLVKQREEAAEQFEKAARSELAERERAEAELLKSYLPEEPGEEAILAAVDRAIAETGASGPQDLGRVMKAALALLREQGRGVDGKQVNAAVRSRLAG